MVRRLMALSTAALCATALLTGTGGAGAVPAQAAAARPATATAAPTAGTFVALPPSRLMDTRIGLGGGAVGPKHTVRLLVSGRGGVPASGVSSVVLNITAVAPLASGYALAWTDGQLMPTASNVIWTAGQNTAGVSVAGVGSTGYVDIYNGSWRSTHFVVDVSGYFLAGSPTAAGAFAPLTPARLLDTRSGLGGRPVQSRSVGRLKVTGRGGVPATGAGAVVLSVTAASPELAGYATVWPDGATRPTASNLNFVAHRSISNLVVARIGSGGYVDIYNGSAWATDYVVDVLGYFVAGASSAAGTLSSVGPARLLDTRTHLGGSAIASGGTLRLQVAGRGGVPANGAAAVVLNLTVASAGAPGFATVWPDGSARPTASNINFLTGMTRANAVFVKVGAGGQVDFYNGSGRTLQVVVDVAAYVHAEPPMTWGQPASVDPAQGGLGGVSCPTTAYCLAFDNNGPASHTLTFSGGTWGKPKPLPWTTGVLTLTCPTTTSCVAFDSAGNARSYDGSAWAAPVSVDPGAQVVSVSCPTVAFCAAVDSGGHAMTFVGGAWTAPVDVDTFTGMAAVSCVSATFCMAVNNDSAFTFDGSDWTTAAQPQVSQPNSVSCVSSTFCAITTFNGGLDVWHGSAWDAGVDNALQNGANSVDCASTSSCVAAGNFGTYAVWNGSAWGAELQATTTLYGVSCPSTTFCAATGNGDSVSTFNGTTWSDPLLVDPIVGHPTALTCATATSCQLLDEFANGSTYDGSSWSPVSLIETGFPYTPTSVSCPTTSFCRAITDYPNSSNGNLLVYDGTTWSQTNDLGGDFVSISCPTTTFCVALATGGRTAIWDGSTWDDTKVARIGWSSSISCVSPTFCLAVGHSNLASTYDGTAWTPFTLPEPDPATPSSVSCPSVTSCQVVNGLGQALHFDGQSWSAPAAIDPAGGGLTSVSCPTAGFCAAVDKVGRALTWDGSAWSVPTAIAPDSDGLVAVSCPTDAFCVTAAKNGDVVIGSR